MSSHTCSECSRPFRRRYNLIRHQREIHPELFDDENDADESDSNDHDDDEDDNESVSTAGEESSDDETGETDEDGDENEDDDIPLKYDLWNYLKQKALGKNHISEKYQDVIDALSSNDHQAEINALRVVLPEIRDSIYRDYEQLLLLWHYAEEDESHQKVMETKRKLIEDENYDDVEAIRYAVKKRRYLIQQRTKTLDDDFEVSRGDETDEVGEDDEEME